MLREEVQRGRSLCESAYLHQHPSLTAVYGTHRSSKASPKPGKRVKEQRKWEGSVSSADAEALNYSNPPTGNGRHVSSEPTSNGDIDVSCDLCVCEGLTINEVMCVLFQMTMVGTMKGQLQQLDSDPSLLPSNSEKPTKTNR